MVLLLLETNFQTSKKNRKTQRVDRIRSIKKQYFVKIITLNILVQELKMFCPSPIIWVTTNLNTQSNIILFS